MNQPNAPVIPVRTAGTSDSPEVVTVLRRHWWLLLAGAAVGGLMALGGAWYCSVKFPKYRATVKFQVLQPPPPLASNSIMMQTNADDISQFIHRQVIYIMQPKILDDIVKSQEFHTNPDNHNDFTSQSRWLKEAGTNPVKRLQKDLAVTPALDSASFEISMRTTDPFEAWNLVNAAQQVYRDHLVRDNSELRSARINSVSQALNNQKGVVQRLNDGLLKFTRSKDMPAITSQHSIELKALETIFAHRVEAESARASAEQYYQQLAKQEQDGKLELTPEALSQVEDDQQVRSLKSQQLGLEQELEVLKDPKSTTTNPITRINEMNTRIQKVKDQITNANNDLTIRAKKAMLDRAKLNFDMLDQQVKYISQLQIDKEKQVKDLDELLIEYQQRVEELKAQNDLLEKLQNDARVLDINSGTDDTRIHLLAEAVIPEKDDYVWPSFPVFITIGVAGGLGLAFALAYLLVLTDTSIRTPRDITKTLQLPLLGFVPDESDDPELRGDVAVSLATSPASMMAESFRQIRSHLTAQTENSPVNTLLVASIAPGGGATTVASNIALGMALNDRRVLLIDANFYRPGLRSVYKELPAEGFTDVINDPALLESVIVPSEGIPRLHVMGAGTHLAGASSEMFECKGFRELMEQLQSRYDLIIFDGAPLNLVSDSLALSARVDGVIPVIRAGEVSRGAVSRVREQLRQVHANLIGFVLNAAQASSSGYFKENYRTFYRYAGQGAKRGPSPR